MSLNVEITGESHSPEMSVKLCGIPLGTKINMDGILKFMERRKASSSAFSTARKEPDVPEIISGIKNGKVTGEIVAVIKNTNTRSHDYENLIGVPRPSHADYPAFVKYNTDFLPGGGRFSGRLTAPLCFAGGIAKEVLNNNGIFFAAHVLSVGDIYDSSFSYLEDEKKLIERLSNEYFPVIDEQKKQQMLELIVEVKNDLDSVGGIVECKFCGLPVGLGGPLDEGLEGEIAKRVFAVPAVKGIEFGEGFGVSKMRGSKANDEFIIKDGIIKTITNNTGGILGGMASGMPLVFKAALKPTPSIAKVQQSVNIKTMQPVKLKIAGRHDSCIVPRAVPGIESAAALAVLDIMIKEGRL